jgi:hypothetical protein
VGGVIALTNAAYAATPSNATKYQGPEYPLAGVTGSVEIYVSDPTLSASSTDTNNCSWYGTVKGGSVTVTTGSTPKFTSSRAEDTSDNSMGFFLSSSNKLVGLAAIDSCTDWAKVTDADVYDGAISSTPIALAASATTTISKCTYSVAYSTTIPANQKLDEPGADYVLVGPVMTTTLVITS